LTAPGRRLRIAAVRLAVALAVALAATTRVAAAAPVELVVAWLPGVERGPVAAAADRAGVAFVDRTPAAPPPVVIGELAVAIEAYEALRLDQAWDALERARAAVDATGAALPPAQLADLFVYRALVRTQRGDVTGAWDEWIAAAVVAPGRVLDPGRFPPQVLAEHARARAAIAAAPPVALTVTGGDGCVVTLDGAPIGATASVAVGPHWLRAECPGAEPWVARPTLIGATATIAIAAQRPEPPDDDALLVTARASGAAGFLAVDLRGEVIRVRRFAATGQVDAERTVARAAGADAIATAVAGLLAPPPRGRATPWYRSRWAWAAGAAGLAAAIAVPLTIWAVGDGGATGATIVGPGGAL
jgi:hypothetical protein